MTVLYDNYRPEAQRRTRVILDAETGLPLIVHQGNAHAVAENAKRLASHFDATKARTGSDEWTLVARIDANTFANLTRLGIAGDEKAMNAWLDHPEAAAFRTDDRRKL